MCELVRAGNSVPPRGTFTAGAGGVTLVFPSGVKVTLEPGAQVSLLLGMLVKTARHETDAEQVQMKRGQLDVTVPLAGQGRRKGLFVRGPSPVTALVPGGHAIVKVNEHAISLGSLAGGASALSAGNGWHFVKPGTVKMLRLDGSVSERSLPEAPRTFDCRTLAFAGTTLGAPITVRWHRGVEGVRRYEVEIMRAGDEAPVARASVTSDESAVSFPMLPSGNYAARVRGVDLDAFVGAWSSPLKLDVIGARLPADGRIADDGSVLIPADDVVELFGAQGLEADLLRQAKPVSSPTQLRLTSRLPTLVRLHRPGEGEALSLRLAPVEVKAAVGFEPAINAPEPSLAIVVRLHAEDGGALPARQRIRPVALLGSETLDLTWMRDGDALRALVPLRQITSGEALRIRVMDGKGRQLGGGQWGAERVASR